MTLCLLVYNPGQYRLREALKAQDETPPESVEKSGAESDDMMVFSAHDLDGLLPGEKSMSTFVL